MYQGYYRQTIYSHGRAAGSTMSYFSDTEKIVFSDSSFDPDNRHVTMSASNVVYSFYASDTIGIGIPLVVRSDGDYYSFVNSIKVFRQFGHDSITAYGASADSRTLQYSPELRWFYSKSSSHTDLSDIGSGLETGTVDESYAYISSAVQSGVLFQRTTAPGIYRVTTEDQGKLLVMDLQLDAAHNCGIFLLDPLARPIRTWQMPIESGERRITLNVADVPSGIYFLKLEAPGVTEVKKLAIVR